MDIRQLQYLAALAREKHFTRAAAACNVTQPTLSGRIRQLELELEVPIVERGQRYRGLTPEGERVLNWAQVILKNWQSMQEELGHLKDHDSGLSGRLVLGGIPSALPMIPLLTKKIRITHPGIDFTVLSQSSEEILRGIADFSVDVGITYLDNEPIEGLLATPLYVERYCLFVQDTHPLASKRRCSCNGYKDPEELSAMRHTPSWRHHTQKPQQSMVSIRCRGQRLREN
jgi:DNA-binding transcriptional LysR family regulator